MPDTHAQAPPYECSLLSWLQTLGAVGRLRFVAQFSDFGEAEFLLNLLPNMKPIHEKRILALSADWQGFGFAAFGGPDDLLDFGTRNFRRSVKIPFEAKILLLLDANQPDVLVVAEPKTTLRRRIMEKIAKVAEAKRIPLMFVSVADIHKAFAPGNRSKYQIAQAIAERYPELQFQLPSPRKAYESEKFGITIFEAAAAGFVYYGMKITP
jgi:hypothetical protein